MAGAGDSSMASNASSPKATGSASSLRDVRRGTTAGESGDPKGRSPMVGFEVLASAAGPAGGLPANRARVLKGELGGGFAGDGTGRLAAPPVTMDDAAVARLGGKGSVAPLDEVPGSTSPRNLVRAWRSGSLLACSTSRKSERTGLREPGGAGCRGTGGDTAGGGLVLKPVDAMTDALISMR